MKKTVILTCPTLRCELEHALAEAKNPAEVIYLPGGLHSDPKHLKSYLQEIIDAQQNIGRLVVCPSGCGGGTQGLQATTAELVVPRTRDCLDVLLASRMTGQCRIERPPHGIFYTASWMEQTQASSIDLAKVEARLGKEAGDAALRKLYKGFEHFYIIDTGAYDIAPVREYLAPLCEVLHGTVEVVRGEYGLLWKIAQENFDEDFWVIPQGGQMPEHWYQPDFNL